MFLNCLNSTEMKWYNMANGQSYHIPAYWVWSFQSRCHVFTDQFVRNRVNLNNWHERSALQSVAVRRSTGNDVSGPLFSPLFIFFSHFPFFSFFLIFPLSRYERRFFGDCCKLLKLFFNFLKLYWDWLNNL